MQNHAKLLKTNKNHAKPQKRGVSRPLNKRKTAIYLLNGLYWQPLVGNIKMIILQNKPEIVRKCFQNDPKMVR